MPWSRIGFLPKSCPQGDPLPCASPPGSYPCVDGYYGSATFLGHGLSALFLFSLSIWLLFPPRVSPSPLYMSLLWYLLLCLQPTRTPGGLSDRGVGNIQTYVYIWVCVFYTRTFPGVLYICTYIHIYIYIYIYIYKWICINIFISNHSGRVWR